MGKRQENATWRHRCLSALNTYVPMELQTNGKDNKTKAQAGTQLLCFLASIHYFLISRASMYTQGI